MWLRIVLIGSCLGVSFSGWCEEKAGPKKDEIVRQFVSAFFSEDEKSLIALSSGRLSDDLKTYFWIKRKVHGEKAGQPRKWEGKIEVGLNRREKVLSREAILIEQDADIYQVKVAGQTFSCGLDDKGKVIVFSDAPAAKGEVKD